MIGWQVFETWKKGFDAWEKETAGLMETMLRNPTILSPAGKTLTAAMKVKALTDRASAEWWGAWGLPTKRDQERALHVLNELQSRILDLEEELADLKDRAPKA